MQRNTWKVVSQGKKKVSPPQGRDLLGKQKGYAFEWTVRFNLIGRIGRLDYS